MIQKSIVSFLIALSLTAIFALPDEVSSSLARFEGPVNKMTLPMTDEEAVYKVLAGFGKKCWIDDTLYFTYKFVEPPKLGTAILRIQLFNKEGEKLTILEITGNSGMPSMGSTHDSGDVPFKLNKKGDYLLPVNFVMAGEWEVKLTFFKDKNVIFRGSFRFNV